MTRFALLYYSSNQASHQRLSFLSLSNERYCLRALSLAPAAPCALCCGCLSSAVAVVQLSQQREREYSYSFPLVRKKRKEKEKEKEKKSGMHEMQIAAGVAVRVCTVRLTGHTPPSHYH